MQSTFKVEYSFEFSDDRTPDDGQFTFLMIVADPEIAAYVARNGVDRLFVDLEVMGKAERQAGLDTVKSAQTIETVRRVRSSAPDAHLLVRINPLHQGSKSEIDEAIDAGCDSIMLPMFHDDETLFRFFDLLRGRVDALPLFETVGSLVSIPQILQRIHLNGLHFGLNDLHLERGDNSIFGPLAEGVLEEPAQALREAQIPFGIGGLARAGEGRVPPELLLAEHVRLGSTSAILSRTFHRRAKTLDELLDSIDFALEISKLRKIHHQYLSADDSFLLKLNSEFRKLAKGPGLPPSSSTI